jgi:hypothetical protein
MIPFPGFARRGNVIAPVKGVMKNEAGEEIRVVVAVCHSLDFTKNQKSLGENIPQLEHWDCKDCEFSRTVNGFKEG